MKNTQNREDFFNKVMCIDLETTDIDTKKAEVIEMSSVWKEGNEYKDFTSLYKPDQTDYILPEVSAVTHIVYSMLEDKKVFEDDRVIIEDLYKDRYLVAHNANYERDVFNNYDFDMPKDWICTYRIAKRLYGGDEKIAQLKLSYLRYYFCLDVPNDLPAHRAYGDAFVCYKLLEHIVDDLERTNSINMDEEYYPQILEYSNSPILVQKMPFGKHKNRLLSDLPKSYISWLVENVDSLDSKSEKYDPDFAYSISKVVEKFTW